MKIGKTIRSELKNVETYLGYSQHYFNYPLGMRKPVSRKLSVLFNLTVYTKIKIKL